MALVTGMLLAFASSALAARGHVESSQLIGSPCTALLEPCGAGLLKEPAGLAVNEATHDIYVADKGNARIQVFDPSGAFLLMFGGGVDKTKVEEREAQEAASEPVTVTPAEENLCSASSGDTCQPGSTGTGQGQIETPEGIAVDNSCVLQNLGSVAACESADPSNGDVYVLDGGQRVVDKYSAAGAYLGQITEAGGQSFAVELLDGVAVDPTGGVWIYQEIRNIDHFSNAEPNVYLPPKILAENPGTGFGHQGFAVDSAGAFYVKTGPGEEGPGAISKVNHAGKLVIAKLDGDQSSTVAVEQTSDVSFVDSATSLAAFSPDGTELERFDFNGELIDGTGIAVNAASGFAYVADAAAGQLLVLAPRPPGPPRIEASQSVTGVTSATAELHAEISPQSEPNEGATSYFFEYDTTPYAEGEPGHGTATPTASLEPDFGVHPVAALIAGLLPGTTYHFRVVATNDQGSTTGAEGAFTTQPVAFFALPDARQWQLVSPANKLGAQIRPIYETGVLQAAADGSAITYLALTPTEPEPAGFTNEEQILSRRDANGWSTHDIGIPHFSATGLANGVGPEYKFFDANLSQAAVQPFGQFISRLSPQASESTAFLRDLGPSCGAACFHPLVTAAPGFANVPEGTQFGEEAECTQGLSTGAPKKECGPKFLGATEDLSKVVLSSQVGLTANPEDHGGLYEWSAGRLTQISILPTGAPAPGGEASLGLFQSGSAPGAISADGSRVLWSRGDATNGALFLRANATAAPSASGACDEAGKACTIQLDAAEPACLAAAECASGGGEFQFASADGSRIFFTSSQPLTADAGADRSGNPGQWKRDLYECRILEGGAGEPTCALSDLTPANGTESAEVQGSILGAGADGSPVYFVAKGVLSVNGADNGAGLEHAQAGKPNLYLSRDGVTTYLATLSGGDEHDWAIDGGTPTGLGRQPTRVSKGGQWLALMSQAPLTGYDNRDAASGQPVAEVYLYSAAAGRLLCASCDPTGARPTGVPYERIEISTGALAGGSGVWKRQALVAAIVPGWTSMKLLMSRYQDRYLSDSGRLFFNTDDALVPADSNGTQDVYQYEPPGSGGCTGSSPTFGARSGGCVDLISAGTSGEESAFLDASESGDDVFFLTRSQLVPQDIDAALDVYDAHACTATVPCLPEPPPSATACSGEACQPPSAAPGEASPGSQSFNGAGNVVNCRKGQVKRAGKCVKKHSKKKHHTKKHQKKTKRRAANHQRRASR